MNLASFEGRVFSFQFSVCRGPVCLPRTPSLPPIPSLTYFPGFPFVPRRVSINRAAASRVQDVAVFGLVARRGVAGGGPCSSGSVKSPQFAADALDIAPVPFWPAAARGLAPFAALPCTRTAFASGAVASRWTRTSMLLRKRAVRAEALPRALHGGRPPQCPIPMVRDAAGN